jgi:hypothetical protein
MFFPPIQTVAAILWSGPSDRAPKLVVWQGDVIFRLEKISIQINFRLRLGKKENHLQEYVGFFTSHSGRGRHIVRYEKCNAIAYFISQLNNDVYHLTRQ